jgi:hypothetical protein
MKSKLARYPLAYTRILAGTPADGTPLEIMLSSPTAAATERLRFYNFLKFLRRNPGEAAHFGDRIDRIVIMVKDSTIRFQLRTEQQVTELDEGLEAALKHMNIPVPGAAATTLTSVPFETAPTLPDVPHETPASPNLIDTLLDAVGKPGDDNEPPN